MFAGRCRRLGFLEGVRDIVRGLVLLASLVHVRADLTAHRVVRNPSLVKCFRMHVWHAI